MFMAYFLFTLSGIRPNNHSMYIKYRPHPATHRAYGLICFALYSMFSQDSMKFVSPRPSHGQSIFSNKLNLEYYKENTRDDWN